MAKWVVYTCVTDGYDELPPPLGSSDAVDYIVFTDNLQLSVSGWKVCPLECDSNLSPALRNRWHKVFGPSLLSQYHSSIYIDGNVRPIGTLVPIFHMLDDGAFDLVLPKHPKRKFVLEDIFACIKSGKIDDKNLADAEYKSLLSEGFCDAGLLTENNIILRRHGASSLEDAMQMWWHYIASFTGRDQISLPHVISKFNIKTSRFYFSHRTKNPYFNISPHLGAHKKYYARLRSRLKARSPDSWLCCLLYKLMPI